MCRQEAVILNIIKMENLGFGGSPKTKPASGSLLLSTQAQSITHQW
jgi:hypothetical protein|tara:strand:+ start:29 stop:166 length:138 start_codon:yes stop_codon:yes gene_type:complete